MCVIWRVRKKRWLPPTDTIRQCILTDTTSRRSRIHAYNQGMLKARHIIGEAPRSTGIQRLAQFIYRSSTTSQWISREQHAAILSRDKYDTKRHDELTHLTGGLANKCTTLIKALRVRRNALQRPLKARGTSASMESTPLRSTYMQYEKRTLDGSGHSKFESSNCSENTAPYP